MYVDPSGHFPFFLLTALLAVGITAAVDYIPDQEFDLHWGWYVGAAVAGAVIGLGISYYATGSVFSSTGKVFRGLFGKTTLYRSVSVDELDDIKKTGKFNLKEGMQAKQFGLNLDETRIFGNQAPFDFDVSVKDIYLDLDELAGSFESNRKISISTKNVVEDVDIVDYSLQENK